MALTSTLPKHLLACALSLGLCACMKPNPLVAELAEAEMAASEQDGEDGEGSPDDEGDPAQDPEQDTGEGPGSEPLVDLGSPSCMLDDRFTPACDECLAEACCELALDCAEDPDCVCISDCIAAGGNNGQCKNECGVKPGDQPSYKQLRTCSRDSCGGECPF